jgi:hypothetical protein
MSSILGISTTGSRGCHEPCAIRISRIKPRSWIWSGEDQPASPCSKNILPVFFFHFGLLGPQMFEGDDQRAGLKVTDEVVMNLARYAYQELNLDHGFGPGKISRPALALYINSVEKTFCQSSSSISACWALRCLKVTISARA